LKTGRSLLIASDGSFEACSWFMGFSWSDIPG
jgi:hypothetical protein